MIKPHTVESKKAVENFVQIFYTWDGCGRGVLRIKCSPYFLGT
jgi:hypothetical protein